MRLRTLLAASIGLGLTGNAMAALMISVPNVQLQPNLAGQLVTLSVSGSDAVTGLNLNAQIGDNGTAAATPLFSAADFSGGIWLGKSTTVTGGPITGAERYVQFSVVLNVSGDAVSASGQVVQLTISTLGVASGTFPLKLAATDIGYDSVFIATGGGDIPVSIQNGSITVAVPEPTALSLVCLANMLLLRRSRMLA